MQLCVVLLRTAFLVFLFYIVGVALMSALIFKKKKMQDVLDHGCAGSLGSCVQLYCVQHWETLPNYIFSLGKRYENTKFTTGKHSTMNLYTPSIPNCKTFDFFAPSLTTRLIQKICANIVKFKSFLKNFY